MPTPQIPRFLICACALAPFSLLFVDTVYAQQTVTQYSDEVEMTITLPKADEAGWIKGLSDFDGIERSVAVSSAHAVRRQNQAPDRIADRAKEIGVDLKAVRELSEAALELPFILDRVEFVPGLDATELNHGIITDFDNLGEFEGGEFSPGLPDRDSLAGFRTSYRAESDPSSGITWHYWTFSDGSTSFYRRVRDETGKTISFTLEITDENGDVEFYHETNTDPDGVTTTQGAASEPPGDEHSEAYEAEGQHITTLDQDDEVPRDAPNNEGAEDVDTPADDPAIDKFQPADGEGSYCPLVFEICRRQMEQALAAGDDIFTGMVLINPAEPDVQPVAPRLIIDPRDLVMDPSGKRRNRAPRNRQAFSQAVLPVWVNPPGPND